MKNIIIYPAFLSRIFLFLISYLLLVAFRNCTTDAISDRKEKWIISVVFTMMYVVVARTHDKFPKPCSCKFFAIEFYAGVTIEVSDGCIGH